MESTSTKPGSSPEQKAGTVRRQTNNPEEIRYWIPEIKALCLAHGAPVDERDFGMLVAESPRHQMGLAITAAILDGQVIQGEGPEDPDELRRVQTVKITMARRGVWGPLLVSVGWSLHYNIVAVRFFNTEKEKRRESAKSYKPGQRGASGKDAGEGSE